MTTQRFISCVCHQLTACVPAAHPLESSDNIGPPRVVPAPADVVVSVGQIAFDAGCHYGSGPTRSKLSGVMSCSRNSVAAISAFKTPAT